MLKSPETISKINEVQLGLIATASLVPSVEVRQVKKVDLFFVHIRTERYDIVPLLLTRNRTVRYITFQFLLHFSVQPNFWTCGGTVRLIFFPYPCDRNPLSLPLLGTEQYDIVNL